MIGFRRREIPSALPRCRLLSDMDLVAEARATERPDLDALADRLGIRIVGMPLRADLCGWIEPAGDGWQLTRNASHRSCRTRFTTAHMIGHVLLHADLMRHGEGRRGTNDDTGYRGVEGVPFRNPLITDERDREATRFAITLTMPADIVGRLADEGLSVFQVAARLDVAPKAMAIRMRGLETRT